MAAHDELATFDDIRTRLDQIVDEVSEEGISLDEALALYEEAVKLGLSACDLSEQDVEAELAASAVGDRVDDGVASEVVEGAGSSEAVEAVGCGAFSDAGSDATSDSRESAS